MKVCFTMTVFNGDYVLKQSLESIYEFASQILISEGCVKYFQNMGYTTSTDKTNEILHSFPDPENKIKILHGQYKEKDAQQNAVNPYIKDCDWLWFLPCDEVFKKQELETLFKKMENSTYTSIGFMPYCFYGGFDRIAGGYDEIYDQLRIFRAYPGTKWSSHRSLTVAHADCVKTLPDNHFRSHDTCKFMRMYHYTYTFPEQMDLKMNYFEKSVCKTDWFIPEYFKEVYLKWVRGDRATRQQIENKYQGVHPFLPKRRKKSFTYKFEGQHPESIQKVMPELIERFNKELKIYEGI